MTILWCGGEDIDFPGGTVDISTGSCRTDYARCSLSTTQTHGVVRGHPFSGGAVQSAWVSARFTFPGSSTGFRRSMRIMGFADFTTGKYLAIELGSSNEFSIDLITYDGSRSILDSTGTIFTASTTYKMDMQLSNYGVSSTIKVYSNGGLVLTFNGDSSISGVTEFDCPIIGGRGDIGVSTYISEIIVSDEDTRLMSLKTLVPNAAGDLNEWSGLYTAIDEVTLSDADVIYTATRGDDFQANLTGMPAGTFKVKGVKAVVRAADSSEILGLKVGIKTNSAIHLEDAHTLEASWNILEKMFQNNPETATAFTSGEIDALQLALRCDSTTTTTSTSSSTTTTS